MKDRPTDHDFKEISALIREEEEEALVIFRTRNFRGRLESRLRKAAAGKKPHFYPRTRAFPALAGILVFIVAVTIYLVLKRPASSPPPELKALTSALGQLPGFSHPPRREWTVPASQTATSPLADSVRLVLVSAEKIRRDAEQEAYVPAGPVKVPRLSLDQKMEILFKERAVERALLLFKGDSKEV